MKTRRRSAQSFRSDYPCWWVRQKHGVESGPPKQAHRPGRFFHRQIGDQHPVNAVGLGVSCQSLQSISEEGIVVAEQKEGHVGLLTQCGNGLQSRAQGETML